MATNNSINISTNPVVNPYPNISVPYTAFNYFVSTNNNGTIWTYSGTLNGNAYTPVTNGLDFGTLNFTILPEQAGVYRFSISYTIGNQYGIQNIICDGVTTSVDMYASGTSYSQTLSWEQTMSAGAKTIQLINAGKNASSSDYYVFWCNDAIQIFRVS